MTDYDVISAIIDYEEGALNWGEKLELFQHLIDSGMVGQLQGSYGRTAAALIEGGHLTPA